MAKVAKIKKTAEKEQSQSKPHFFGHRDRLRERFRKRGLGGIADYELVELILCRALPRSDVKPLAKVLLKTFGSFANLVHADRDTLLAHTNVGERVADEFLLFHEAIQHALHHKLESKPLLTAWQDLFNYCQQNIGYKSRECLHVFFLNTQHYLIKDEIIHEGIVDRANIYPREILRQAINYNASSIVLAHNHPSGIANPSREDILLTKEIAKMLKAAGIKLHDHIVVARDQITSFQQLHLFRELDP